VTRVAITLVKIFRFFVVGGLALLASLSRGTTLIYPADAIDEFWNLNAEEFRAKYAGINATGLGPSDEGWYVRYRHENLTCLFGPLAEREDARKRKWDLETVRDAAIRNRASLASSQVDFVRFTFSGIYGKGGGGGGGGNVDDFPRVSPDGKYGPDGDMNGNGIPNRLDPDMNGNGIPNEKDLDSDGDGIPNDKDDYPFGPHPSTWGKPGVAVDEHGHAIDGTGGGDGQGGDGKGGDGKDGSGKGGSGKAGAGDGGDQSGAIADASANGKGSGKGGKGGKSGKGGSQGGGSEAGDGSDGSGGQGGQSGQNGRQVASNQRGGSRGGQGGQSGQQGGQSGQSGGQQGGQQGSSGQSGGGQSGSGSSGGQPGGGGDSSPMSGGSSGGGGNPLSLIAGLLKKILGL
jgi:hypothetical protein